MERSNVDIAAWRQNICTRNRSTPSTTLDHRVNKMCNLFTPSVDELFHIGPLHYYIPYEMSNEIMELARKSQYLIG